MERVKYLIMYFLFTSMIIESSRGQFPPLPPIPLSPPPASAPSGSLTCLTELVACTGASLSSPSATCCNTLKTVYKNEYDCLCAVVQTQMNGFNMTQMSDLLVNCNIIKTSTGFCNSTAPPGLHSPPPPHKNDAFMYKITWISLSGLASFVYFFFWY